LYDKPVADEDEIRELTVSLSDVTNTGRNGFSRPVRPSRSEAGKAPDQ
jgi:hypothetical protein